MNRRQSPLYCKDILIHRAQKITYARLRALSTLRGECVADTVDASLQQLIETMSAEDPHVYARYAGMVAAWMRDKA